MIHMPLRLPSRSLFLVFSIAIAVRLIAFLPSHWANSAGPRPFPADSPRYIGIADTLRDHGIFGKKSEDGLVHQAIASLRQQNGTLPQPDHGGWYPEVFRTPGYPVFLALFSGSDGLPFSILTQCLLTSLASPCLASIALSLGCSERTSLAAGYIWSLHPAVVTYDLLPLTESIFCSLSILGLASLSCTRILPSASLAGLLIGLAGLVRPLELLYLLTAITLSWRQKRHRTAAMALVIGLTISPSAIWMTRNYATGNGLRVSTVGNVNLHFYGAAYVLSENRDEDWFLSWPAKVDELSTMLSKKNRPGTEVFSLVRNEALLVFAKHPRETIAVAAKSTFKLATDHSLSPFCTLYGIAYEPSGFVSEILRGKTAVSRLTWSSVWPLLWSGLNITVVLLTLVGLAKCSMDHNWRLIIACVAPIALFTLATFPVGLERFRLPMIPFLAILAARGAMANSVAPAPPST